MNLLKFLFDYKTDNIKTYSFLICLFCIINLILLMPDFSDLYSNNGYVFHEINDKFLYPYDIRLSMITNFFENGRIEIYVIIIILSIYFLSLLFNIFDYFRIFFSIIALLIHVMLVNSSFLFSYGADYFISFLLFINIFLSIEKSSKYSKIIYSFAIRLLQIQLCFVYFFAGFGKILGTDWLDGNAMWYVLNTFSPSTAKCFSNHILFFKILSWFTLFCELLYPFLVFQKYTQKVIVISVIILHLGIIFFMKFYTFGSVMILLNIIAWENNFKLINKLLSIKNELIRG